MVYKPLTVFCVFGMRRNVFDIRGICLTKSKVKLNKKINKEAIINARQWAIRFPLPRKYNLIRILNPKQKQKQISSDE